MLIWNYFEQFFGSLAVAYPFLRYIFPKWLGYTGVKNGSKKLRAFLQVSSSLLLHDKVSFQSLCQLIFANKSFIKSVLCEAEKSSSLIGCQI